MIQLITIDYLKLYYVICYIMRVIIEKNYEDMTTWVSLYIKNKINMPRTKEYFVLGLPTGSTPLGVYKNLIQYVQEGSLSFQKVITFNMDEYVGLESSNINSYSHFMFHHFFNHIDIPLENINLLNGMVENLEAECKSYEQKINDLGIDLFLCGVGSDGHIAFNEPGSSLTSVTRIKTLSEETIIDNSRFFNSITDVPIQALTVGIQTIMSAYEIIIMASGIKKSLAIKECIEGAVSNQYTCTVAQQHQHAIIACDYKSTYELKVKTLEYYLQLQKNIDLLGKPIRNVIQENFSNEQGILITSPHPDDDVIGIGGIMQLFSNKAQVTIAYMTNGQGGIRNQDNQGDYTRIKEAISSIKVLGYNSHQVIDATLPFYSTSKREVSVSDIQNMEQLLEEQQPCHVFICVDCDPKGTHLKCAYILQQCQFPESVQHLWLYKSAWGNWNHNNIITHTHTIYIPNDLFLKKLLAIDMHISQINPEVTHSTKINTFKDVVLTQNKSEKYPGHYQEKLRNISIVDYKKMKFN